MRHFFELSRREQLSGTSGTSCAASSLQRSADRLHASAAKRGGKAACVMLGFGDSCFRRALYGSGGDAYSHRGKPVVLPGAFLSLPGAASLKRANSSAICLALGEFPPETTDIL
jgi:hypothetical protein